MKVLDGIQQGSDQWLAVRRQSLCASEAAAMLGFDKRVSRTDLLHMKATGGEREFSDWTQKNLLDKGHEIEAAARSVAENIIGESVYPIVGTLDIDGLPLLASFDGVVMDESIVWECKSRNAALLAALEAGNLPDEHWPQVEQQLLISGASKALFTPTDGTEEGTVKFWYASHPDRRAMLLAGWRQFQIDSAAYVPVEVLPPATAAVTKDLPALSIQVKGEISLTDNLKLFGAELEAFIKGLDTNPSTDQAFADAEAAIKTLGAAETALEAAKANGLAQVASVEEMTRTVALYAGQARQTRLMLEKLVKVRKESIRVEIVQGGKDALAAHVAGLIKRLGKPYLPVIPADFAGAIKGKKTVASLKDAVDTELALAKIEANRIADQIQINLTTLRELAADHAFLFADAAQIVLKANDDLTALVKTRIRDHQEAEAKRLEAERERIRQEEIAKLAAEEARKAKEPAAAPANVTASEHSAQPAPAAVLKPVVTLKASGKVMPSDAAIIHAVAVAFQVNDATALEWLFAVFGQQAA